VESPLTDVGREQARRLGVWLAEHQAIGAFYASPLLRARQTAEIVNRFLGMEIAFLGDLCEAEEYLVAHVPQHADPLVPLAATQPDSLYEAFRSQVERAMAYLMEAETEHSVLVIAHGGTLGTLIRLLLGAPAALISTDNCALHRLSWQHPEADPKLGGHWLVHYLNRRAHLDVET
jgi:broad specificity phosphatase PhoE